MPSDLAVTIVNSNIQRGLIGSEYNTRNQQCEAAARDIDLAVALESDDFEITVLRVDLLVEVVSDVVGKEGGVRMTGDGIVALLHDFAQPCAKRSKRVTPQPAASPSRSMFATHRQRPGFAGNDIRNLYIDPLTSSHPIVTKKCPQLPLRAFSVLANQLLLIRPHPILHLGHVVADLVDIVLVLNQLVLELLPCVGTAALQLRQAVDHVDRQAEAVGLVHHHHVERRRGAAFLDIATRVQVVVAVAAVGQAVDQPRVAVEGEDDRFVGGEDRVELRIT